MLKARIQYRRLEAGCDEVGRGCLAGPVVAAAVILPPRFKHEHLRDSKKLSAAQRSFMEKLIQEKAIAWAVSEVSPAQIDEINILRASYRAMETAVGQLAVEPEHLLIDGNRFQSELDIPFTCVVKGDNKFGSIAAASILAKCHRDRLMHELHLQHPQYGWDTNVGYPTSKHREAIKAHGITEYHRKSFQLLPDLLVLDL